MTPIAFLPGDNFVGFALADVLDAAQCGELIGVLARRGFAPTGEAYPRDYRDNDRLVFDDAELAARWFERIGAQLPRDLVIDGVAWRLHGLNPRFRACRYRGGQAFCVHRDGPHQPDDVTRSLLTVQLYLDDASDMTGGRTRFYRDRSGRELWAAIAPRRGTAIVFDHRVWHDGEAVTSGVKHVLRTDVMYRRVAATALPGPSEIGRHRGYAWRAIVCRDGSIASGGRDGTVRRWIERSETGGSAPRGSDARALGPRVRPPPGCWRSRRSPRRTRSRRSPLASTSSSRARPASARCRPRFKHRC